MKFHQTVYLYGLGALLVASNLIVFNEMLEHGWITQSTAEALVAVFGLFLLLTMAGAINLALGVWAFEDTSPVAKAVVVLLTGLYFAVAASEIQYYGLVNKVLLTIAFSAYAASDVILSSKRLQAAGDRAGEWLQSRVGGEVS